MSTATNNLEAAHERVAATLSMTRSREQQTFFRRSQWTSLTAVWAITDPHYRFSVYQARTRLDQGSKPVNLSASLLVHAKRRVSISCKSSRSQISSRPVPTFQSYSASANVSVIPMNPFPPFWVEFQRSKTRACSIRLD